MTKRLIKYLRLVVLLLILLLSLAGYYLYSHSGIRVETVQFKSNLLGKTLPYNVLLPPGYDLITERTTRYPVLYLLHNWSGNYTSWLNSTSLSRYAAEHRLIIVMPEGDNGWYTDSATVESDKYETYLLQELMPDVDARFRTIRTRAARSVAGNSMGGYGALKFGLKHPEQFVLAASMSGALDATMRTDDTSIMEAFGPVGSPARPANDLRKLAIDYPEQRFSQLPFFYMDCGTEDPWLGSNRELSDIFTKRGIAHEYRQLHGGHVWPYWDRQVRDVLRLAEEIMLPPQS
jgi:putative tributyrin esterase